MLYFRGAVRKNFYTARKNFLFFYTVRFYIALWLFGSVLRFLGSSLLSLRFGRASLCECAPKSRKRRRSEKPKKERKAEEGAKSRRRSATEALASLWLFAPRTKAKRQRRSEGVRSFFFRFDGVEAPRIRFGSSALPNRSASAPKERETPSKRGAPRTEAKKRRGKAEPKRKCSLI
uniref:Transmembrane protein n=1 Tax=Lacunastrum gracillimum TaxID=427913 RepID=A0A2U8GHI4_9CHLO|nr:hypothetical protein [Lacunastrum gracillimum]YP_009491923.1 hypothetical protein [Lacunastrum gracillimum]AWI68047.1 hypothetical protein [Lacunastrum gracillimum]AWI68048.1 hypothetical protein [Lacunastrum gracillimum]